MQNKKPGNMNKVMGINHLIDMDMLPQRMDLVYEFGAEETLIIYTMICGYSAPKLTNGT